MIYTVLGFTRIAPIHDLHNNGRRHVGINAAFHDHDAHDSVTNSAALDGECSRLITECADVADYKTRLHAFSFGSPGKLWRWLEHATSPETRFQRIGFSRFRLGSAWQCDLGSYDFRCARAWIQQPS
jgi:hypothetical protein